MEGGYLFSSVLVQGLYQLICSAALPQNLSGSATEAAKWVLYSPPPPAVDSDRQPRPPRAPRGPGATYALRAGPAPRAAADPGRDPPSPPAPVTLRHCNQDGFIAAGRAPRSRSALGRQQRGRPRRPQPRGERAGGGGSSGAARGALKFGRNTRAAGKSRPGASGEATGWSGGWGVGGRGRGHHGRNPAPACAPSAAAPARKAPWSCRTSSLLPHASGPRGRPTHPSRFQQTGFQTNKLCAAPLT